MLWLYFYKINLMVRILYNYYIIFLACVFQEGEGEREKSEIEERRGERERGERGARE